MKSSLALSFELKLFAFGIISLNIYCLKHEIEIESVVFKEFISFLAFAKSNIVYGKTGRQLNLVDSQSSNIKK